jgi:saccharopine dehydrogenase-like NADP-dependent oxidoreductase
MKKIMVIGAGRSSASLIRYLLEQSERENWKVVVADYDLSLAEEKTNKHPNSIAIQFDAQDVPTCDKYIKQMDAVVSLLPPSLHYLAALSAVKFGKHFLTASYVSKEIGELGKEALSKNVLLLNELGLDPGIDHMSAMQIIEKLKAEGAEIKAFKSYCGGLVAPEYDDNPWNYKFTWNPRNVVLAGQGTAQYRKDGKIRYLPYHRLFSELETFHFEGLGDFEGYANRNSLSYIDIYGLSDIPTMIRGTLRRSGYARSWNTFVQLGMTDDGFRIAHSADWTYREFTDSFLPENPALSTEQKMAAFLNVAENAEIIDKLKWLGIFESQKIGLANASPAQVLQKILEEKWQLKQEDKDMIVMQHLFDYQKDGKKYRLTSSLVVKGDSVQETAMAKTVGLPLGIGAKLLLKDQISLRGLQLPTVREIYEPILAELKSMGIEFTETTELI